MYIFTINALISFGVASFILWQSVDGEELHPNAAGRHRNALAHHKLVLGSSKPLKASAAAEAASIPAALGDVSVCGETLRIADTNAISISSICFTNTLCTHIRRTRASLVSSAEVR